MAFYCSTEVMHSYSSQPAFEEDQAGKIYSIIYFQKKGNSYRCYMYVKVHYTNNSLFKRIFHANSFYAATLNGTYIFIYFNTGKAQLRCLYTSLAGILIPFFFNQMDVTHVLIICILGYYNVSELGLLLKTTADEDWKLMGATSFGNRTPILQCCISFQQTSTFYLFTLFVCWSFLRTSDIIKINAK